MKKLLNSCKELEENITQVLSDVEDILFINKSESVTRLLPSFYDRKPFRDILTMQNEASEDSNSDNISYQTLAKHFFSKRIQEEAAAQKVQINILIDYKSRPLILFSLIFKDYPSRNSAHVLL